MKKIIVLILMFVGMVSSSWAQVDDVTLVVNGEGATKDEATTKALRSAIEQAFGVFVSANTEILNDELVKDEIATVASGNVKKYTELGIVNKQNGNIEVSLQATVSVKKLTSYAQNHGSSAEFAGATYAANLKLLNLNRENTKKAYNNLVKQIKTFGNNLFDCYMKLGDPQENGTIPVTLYYYTTEKSAQLVDLIISTLSALSITYSEKERYLKNGVKLYNYKFPSNCISSGFENWDFDNDKIVSFLEPIPYILISPNVCTVYDNMGNVYPVYVMIHKGSGTYEPIIHKKGCFHGSMYRTGYYSGSSYVSRMEYREGKDIMISEPWIAIPSEYKGKWRKVKKDKNKISVFDPKFIAEIEGYIYVPADRIEKITEFTVKVNDN